MGIFITISIVLLILFFPIFINISLGYSATDYYVKVYGIFLISKSKNKNIFLKSNKNSSSSEDEDMEATFENNRGKEKAPKTKTHRINISDLLKRILHNRYKPKLKLTGDLNYSFEDTATTAISYGLLNNVLMGVLLLLQVPLKVPTFKLNIIPEFNSETSIKVKIKCIISFNLAKLLYILFLILKSREKIEEE